MCYQLRKRWLFFSTYEILILKPSQNVCRSLFLWHFETLEACTTQKRMHAKAVFSSIDSCKVLKGGKKKFSSFRSFVMRKVAGC